MRYKYVLFDLDGTLLDTNELILRSFEHALSVHVPGQFARQDILPHMGAPLIEQMNFFCPGQAEEAIKTYRRFNLAEHDSLVVAFPHAADVLGRLKEAGYKLGVVTSKMRMTTEKGLNLTGLHSYFDAIVTMDDTDKHKPDAEPVLRALELLGGTPEQAVMVGDSPFDIGAGKAAGTATIGVKWSLRGEEGLRPLGPDYLVDTLLDVEAIVRGDAPALNE